MELLPKENLDIDKTSWEVISMLDDIASMSKTYLLASFSSLEVERLNEYDYERYSKYVGERAKQSSTLVEVINTRATLAFDGIKKMALRANGIEFSDGNMHKIGLVIDYPNGHWTDPLHAEHEDAETVVYFNAHDGTFKIKAAQTEMKQAS